MMRILRRAVVIFLFLLACNMYSQNQGFTSDRPGLSDSPDLIVAGSFQLETGFDISEFNRYGFYQLSVNTLRYALNTRIEARMDFGLQYDSEKKNYSSALSSLGLKYLLFGKENKLPKTAVIIEYYPPPFGGNQASSGLGIEICISHGVVGEDSLYYNAGLQWPDLSDRSISSGLLGYNHVFNKVWQAFSEFYYYRRYGTPFNLVTDVGFTAQVNERVQFDFSCGIDLRKPNGNSYFSGGLTYSFLNKNK